MRNVLAAIAATTLVSGCLPPENVNPFADMVNPASQYCVDRGGEVQIRGIPEGEAGYCRLPDGRLVEEWKFFRGEDDVGDTTTAIVPSNTR